MTAFVYSFILGINFFTYEKQLIPKIERAGKGTTMVLSEESVVDILTGAQITFWLNLWIPLLWQLTNFFFFFFKDFQKLTKKFLPISSPSNNSLIKFEIRNSSKFDIHQDFWKNYIKFFIFKEHQPVHIYIQKQPSRGVS